MIILCMCDLMYRSMCLHATCNGQEPLAKSLHDEALIHVCCHVSSCDIYCGTRMTTCTGRTSLPKMMMQRMCPLSLRPCHAHILSCWFFMHVYVWLFCFSVVNFSCMHMFERLIYLHVKLAFESSWQEKPRRWGNQKTIPNKTLWRQMVFFLLFIQPAPTLSQGGTEEGSREGREGGREGREGSTEGREG